MTKNIVKTVAIESPIAGQLERNREYLKRCILDCLGRGETPYASHAVLTLALDDTDPEQRREGLLMGLCMSATLDQRVFFIDYGWSSGMVAARHFYDDNGLSYVERTIL
jgi:hypothetical protein